MTVIAINSQMGTQGPAIAKQVARLLRIEFADELHILDKIAERMTPVEPRVAGLDDQLATFRSCLGRSDQTLARFAIEEIMELAAYGSVTILGWGAASVLRNAAHVVRVRLYAPMSSRLPTLARSNPHLDFVGLQRLVEQSDASLATNLEPIYGPGWRTGDFYHLEIDTSTTSPCDAAARIVHFVTTKHQSSDWSTRNGKRFNAGT